MTRHRYISFTIVYYRSLSLATRSTAVVETGLNAAYRTATEKMSVLPKQCVLFVFVKELRLKHTIELLHYLLSAISNGSFNAKTTKTLHTKLRKPLVSPTLPTAFIKLLNSNILWAFYCFSVLSNTSVLRMIAINPELLSSRKGRKMRYHGHIPRSDGHRLKKVIAVWCKPGERRKDNHEEDR